MLRPKDEMTAPQIHTELPGPNAKALIDLDHQYTSPSYTRGYPLTVRRAEGAIIEDMDGNLFLDFTSGIAVCSTGHCHPRVVEAIKNQADHLLHMSGTDFYYPTQAKLAERLAKLLGDGQANRVFFTNSGTESVEAALKLARYYTQRKHIIGFFGAFHGRTMGALSLTSSKVTQRKHFGPLIPQVSHVGFPTGDSADATFDEIDRLFQRTVAPEEVAAFVVEPIQGEGGYLVPPADFHRRLKALCEQHGILYVADEVQAGMGRTGKMFATEHFGVVPDIICLAKGIASGMPLGAIIARDEVMSWPPGTHASTFGGNPISCAAALATIDLLESEYMANATEVGNHLKSQLQAELGQHPAIKEIRGVGLMLAAEMSGDKHEATKLRDAVVDAAFERGLLLLGCGSSAIRFCPPLSVTHSQVDKAADIFSNAVRQCG